jgi:hypothetical protein
MPNSDAALTKSAPEKGAILMFPEIANYSSGHSLLDPIHQRTIAIAAGDFRLTVAREVQRLLQEGDQLSAIKIGLNRLHSEGAMNPHELKLMTTAANTVFAAQAGKIDVHTAIGRIRPIYDELLLDNSSSPVALTICSLVTGSYASFLSDQPISTAAAVKPALSNNGDVGMFAGAIIGAIVGGALGGFIGFGLGAGIGGAIGGAVGSCIR